MPRPHATFRNIALLGILSSSALLGEAPGPLPISPGEESGSRATAPSCPTFSWALPTGPADRFRGFELRIVPEDRADHESRADPRTVRLPAGARSWTPSAEGCLEAGGRFSWSIRGLPRESTDADSRQESTWSEDRSFDVQKRPADEELAWAIDVLRRAHQPVDSQDAGTTEAARARTVVPSERQHPGRHDSAGPREAVPADAITMATPTTVSAGSRVAGPIWVSGVDAEEVTATSVESTRELFAGALTLELGADALTLWNDGNQLVISSDFDPGAGTGSNDGTLLLRTLSTTEELEVGYLGLQVSKGAWDGGGGAGYGSVPVEYTVGYGSNIKVDTNASVCPDGGIVVGMQLAETDTDQLGIRVRCTRKPRP